MKNLNAIRPGAQELNESIRRPENILELKVERVMVEPKFDGAFIYITHDRAVGRAVLCTKDGNELRLAPVVQNFILHFERLTEHFLFEAELEPDPWSEANKVALNGNLYSGREMPFSIRLVVHEVLPMDEVEKPVSTARQRYALIRALAGVEDGVQLLQPYLWDKSERVNICITPCQEITREAAVELFRIGWERGKAHKRVMVGGLPGEGLVLIDRGASTGRDNAAPPRARAFVRLDRHRTSYHSIGSSVTEPRAGGRAAMSSGLPWLLKASPRKHRRQGNAINVVHHRTD